MKSSLKILAGENAFQRLKKEGISPDKIGIITGAAGGPKWLILSELDKALFGHWLPSEKRIRPLHLIGSSIGSWRFAATTQNNPIQAINQFEKSYLSQNYSAKPTPQEITQEGFRILEEYVSDHAIEDLLNHPYYRLNIVTVACKNLFKSENKTSLLTGMGIAAATNALHPRFLNHFFERSIFSDSRDSAPFLKTDKLLAKIYPLTKANFRKALMASGSIPGVMSAIDNLHDTEKVVFRDGGMLDYHMDYPFVTDPLQSEYVLFPHYTDKIVPGWFDKYLPWRKHSRLNSSNTILISPSREFISRLPHSKIPDRNDFKLYANNDEGRVKYWKKVLDESKRLHEDFLKIFSTDSINEIVEPL